MCGGGRLKTHIVLLLWTGEIFGRDFPVVSDSVSIVCLKSVGRSNFLLERNSEKTPILEEIQVRNLPPQIPQLFSMGIVNFKG